MDVNGFSSNPANFHLNNEPMLPTKAEAQKTFWLLGVALWKELASKS